MTLTVDDVFSGLAKNDYTCFNDWKIKYGIDIHTKCGGTLLTWALRRKQSVDTISFLIKNNADVNQKEKGGATPLLIAIHLNLLEVVKCLHKNGADITKRDSYNTPLTAAVKAGDLEMVKFLLNNNANPSQCDLEGVPPFIRAIRDNKLKIVEIFLRYQKGVDVVDTDKNTPLIAAIQHNSEQEIIGLLVDYIDVDESKNENTPLGWAAEEGNLEAVKLLLSKGADINKLCANGNTALANAVYHGELEVAKYLMDNNANVCKVGEHGKTPLLLAVIDENLDMIKLLLDHGAEYIIHKVFLDAITTKNLEIVECLMERMIRINDTPCRNSTDITPLEKAVLVGSVEIAKYFLENNADVVEDLHHKEISHILVLLAEENTEMLQLLTENGARLNEFGDCGATVLTKSVDMGHFEMVKYFLAQGADVNQANQDGLTPLAIAEANNDFKIFQYLVECGATISEEEKEKNPNVVMYYNMTKKNILRRQRRNEDIEASNQESA